MIRIGEAGVNYDLFVRQGQAMQMKISLAIAVCLIALVQASAAQCRAAKENEVPHGANELIQLKSRTVPRVYGTVLWPTGEAAKKIVVEIFHFEGSDDDYRDFNAAIEQPRTMACVTGDDGKFSFPGLKLGKYLLRAGTSDEAGVNETYIVLVVKRHSRKPGKDGLEITLHLGT